MAGEGLDDDINDSRRQTCGHATIPDTQTFIRLFVGGLVGLLVWELWARFATPPVAGFPLEPPELVRTLIHYQTGITVSLTTATILHYAVGIVGYPWPTGSCRAACGAGAPFSMLVYG